MTISSIYSQEQLAGAEQQFTEQQAALEERLAGDMTVVGARQKLANAQASLEHLQNTTRGMPYQERVKWLNDITAQKQAVKDAEQEVRAATNANSQMYRRVKVVEDQAQLKKRQAEQQAQFAKQAEQEAKREFQAAWVQSGGSVEAFEQAWVTTIWTRD